MDQIVWVQDSAFATWVRESSWAIFAALIVHTLGMGLLVGAGVAIALRMLGIARTVPAIALLRLRPIIWASLGLAVVSGAVLVAAYPAKALTNPLFFLKLAVAGLALWLTLRLPGRPPEAASTRAAAVLCAALWPAALIAGKFLAYTHKILLAY